MGKSIHTLISDIYSLIGGPDGITNLPADLGGNIQAAVAASLGPRETRGLRLSGMGDKCPYQLWNSVHHPDLEEPLPPYARIKYAYGHIIEHFVIALAKAAGHTVEGEQDVLSVEGIRGHRDCIIDGCVVDVKSAATGSFLKFKEKTIANSDSFGYLAQVDAYVVGSLEDPRVTVKDRGYLLAVDKQLGHLCLYEHIIRPLFIRERIQRYKGIVNGQVPPRCTCETHTVAHGNVELNLTASYNSFKHACAESRGEKIRTFLYSDGPHFLTHVAKRPFNKNGPITEVDKDGKIVYNG